MNEPNPWLQVLDQRRLAVVPTGIDVHEDVVPGQMVGQGTHIDLHPTHFPLTGVLERTAV